MSKLRDKAKLARLALATVAWFIIGRTLVEIARPWFDDLTKWGWHDWDFVTMSRWLTVTTIKKFHQFPFWNPYTCGGHTTWGYVEADTTIVSPWLPVYLLAPLPVALRVEVLGTALVGAWGTWLLVGRFTKSIAARAFVAVVFVLNGRFALQAAAGHLWHSYYAYMPWALYFYDRAAKKGIAETNWLDAVWSGAFVALMVYAGAVYPLPHTVLLLLLYGSLLAVFYRSVKPLAMGLVVGATAFGLSAPKLLPIAHFFEGTPRYFESPETMGLPAFVTMFTSKDQDFVSRPAAVSHWGWHEWGIYIGWVPFVLLGLSVFFAHTKRTWALKIIGAIFVVLGFGAFHENAPWPLLHKLPVFQSQHVPSRWLYPAVLVLGLVFAAVIGQLLDRRRFWIAAVGDVALLALVAFVAADIAPVSALPMKRVFWMQLPDIHVEPTFHQETTVPASLRYVVSDWSLPALPAMMSNIGVLECYGVAGLSVYNRNAQGFVPGMGAKGRGDPAYHGEAYVVGGPSQPRIESFTPNEVVVDVDDAKPGDVLVLNQNYYAGWSVNGKQIANHEDKVATTLQGGHERLVFRCGAPGLGFGLVIFLLTIGVLGWLMWLERRRRRAPSPL